MKLFTKLNSAGDAVKVMEQYKMKHVLYRSLVRRDTALPLQIAEADYEDGINWQFKN